MKRYFTLFFICLSLYSSAQMDLLDSMSKAEKPKREYVSYTFKTTRILTGHSIETVKKNAIDFRVSHRFGDMFATKNDNYHSLFGFDQAADIGIIVEYGILDDLTVGIGRMKGAGPVHELWNGNLKYRALKQTKDFRIPFTITLFGNVALTSMQSSIDSTSLTYFPRGYRGFAHRLSYVGQVMIASKVTNWLSLQLTPGIVWRNVVPNGDNNLMVTLGFSGRARVSKRTAIVWEYSLPLTSGGGREFFPVLRGIKNASYYPPLVLGMEFETGGHVFHVNLSNSAGLLENDFLPYSPKNWLQGQFRMGFTISRTFQIGHGAKDKKYWKKGSVEDQK